MFNVALFVSTAAEKQCIFRSPRCFTYLVETYGWASGVHDLKVRRLHAFVKEKHPDAECLETVAVSRGVVEQLNAVADEAVARDSWFEVRTL